MSHDVRRVEIVVRGNPVAQPRPRARALKAKQGKAAGKYVAQIYNPSDADGWKDRITLAASLAGLPREPWTGPVRVTIDVYFDRKKEQLKRKYPDGPFPHTSKPDRDNVEKAILDALKKCRLFRDDAQVCDGRVRKWWAARGCAPGARIVAELLDPVDQQMTLQDALPSGDRS